MNNVSIHRFFKVTSDLIKHTKEIKKLKGENFNLFQILRMETAENSTHSNFIAEMLNPYGSHDLGVLPLEHFLKTVDFETESNLLNVRITTEYHIGSIDRKNATGGRIDILIQFPNGQTICVENKIYAGDQPQQIQRYCNYNGSQNRVYYLTLTGNDPSTDSKGDLECDIDYFVISYQKHILRWLDLCLKDATNQPILRESIKQYIILINKLTNTLEDTEQTKLKNLIFDYLEESEYISSNYARALYETKDAFRNAVLNQLNLRLDQDIFHISVDCDVDRKYSQIWIDIKGVKNPQLRFGIEPFSGVGHHDGNMFVGIYDREGAKSDFQLEEMDYFTDIWIVANYLKDPHNNLIRIKEPSFLKRVHNPESKDYQEIISTLIDQTIDFVTKYQNEVGNYLKLNSVIANQESQSN